MTCLFTRLTIPAEYCDALQSVAQLLSFAAAISPPTPRRRTELEPVGAIRGARRGACDPQTSIWGHTAGSGWNPSGAVGLQRLKSKVFRLTRQQPCLLVLLVSPLACIP